MELQKPRVLTKDFWSRHPIAAGATMALALTLLEMGTGHLDDVKTLAAQNIRGEVLEYVPYLDRGLIERQRDLEVGYEMEEIAPWIMEQYIKNQITTPVDLRELAALKELEKTDSKAYWEKIWSLSDISVIIPISRARTFSYHSGRSTVEAVRATLDLHELSQNLGESFYHDPKYGEELTFINENEYVSTVDEMDSPNNIYASLYVNQIRPEAADCDTCPIQTQTPEYDRVIMSENDGISRAQMYALARSLRSIISREIQPSALILDLVPRGYDGAFTLAENSWSNAIIVQGITEEGDARYFASKATNPDAEAEWLWNGTPY